MSVLNGHFSAERCFAFFVRFFENQKIRIKLTQKSVQPDPQPVYLRTSSEAQLSVTPTRLYCPGAEALAKESGGANFPTR